MAHVRKLGCMAPVVLFGIVACSSEPTSPGLRADAGATTRDAEVSADAPSAPDAAVLADAQPDDATPVAVDAGGADVGFGDPFVPMPDESEGLVNVSTDLDAILEHGELEGACARSEASPNDRRLRLLCGKSMFFDEPFGTTGVPGPIIDFLAASFPDQIGAGFEHLGMVRDPRSMKDLPLGLAESAVSPGTNVPTYAFTCASCHFSRLPDGRYAVGAANHALEYGKLNLAIAVFPMIASGRSQPTDHDPAAVAQIQPMLDHVQMTTGLRTRLLLALLPLASVMAPSFPVATEHDYATWRTGTMDFLIEPLPMNDHVHTISKISSLFGIPTDAEMRAAGMPNAMLGFTGVSTSVEDFLLGFVYFGVGDVAAWPAAKLAPLAEYIFSLRPPAPAVMPDAAMVAEGARLFESRGCITCHAGPRGSGTRLYTYEEIGTDPAMRDWGRDGASGACCNLDPAKLTHAIKSPRLVGMWGMTRFLHDGAVSSLEDLLCKTTTRPTTTELAYGDQGHLYGCDLPAAEKDALLAYLRAH